MGLSWYWCHQSLRTVLEFFHRTGNPLLLRVFVKSWRKVQLSPHPNWVTFPWGSLGLVLGTIFIYRNKRVKSWFPNLDVPLVTRFWRWWCGLLLKSWPIWILAGGDQSKIEDEPYPILGCNTIMGAVRGSSLLYSLGERTWTVVTKKKAFAKI